MLYFALPEEYKDVFVKTEFSQQFHFSAPMRIEHIIN